MTRHATNAHLPAIRLEHSGENMEPGEDNIRRMLASAAKRKRFDFPVWRGYN